MLDLTGRPEFDKWKEDNAMLSEQELQTKLTQSPAPRVTVESMESRIKKVSYLRFSETVTICNIELDNGYSVRGESACVSPENYDQAIGQTIAYKNAFGKLWPLFGFLLAEKLHGNLS